MSLSIPDYGVRMECGNKPRLGEFKIPYGFAVALHSKGYANKIQNSKNGFLILRV
jgi:hypothetical protein